MPFWKTRLTNRKVRQLISPTTAPCRLYFHVFAFIIGSRLLFSQKECICCKNSPDVTSAAFYWKTASQVQPDSRDRGAYFTFWWKELHRFHGHFYLPHSLSSTHFSIIRLKILICHILILIFIYWVPGREHTAPYGAEQTIHCMVGSGWNTKIHGVQDRVPAPKDFVVWWRRELVRQD